MGLISRLDTAEKRIVNWRICQQNALKQKSREKRDKEIEYLRTVGNDKRHNIYIMGI